MDLYDSLARWNLWGSWQTPESVEREATKTICDYADTDEVIALIGPRRAGKSTILYQVMQHLLARGVEAKALLHINFEEPALATEMAPQLLDKLYDGYRSMVFPNGKAYLFLDEIQNVPQWERWVRARNDIEDIKIFITGSSSSLLSGELATALSGRNFCFEIYPLSFKEVLQFKKIELPNQPFTTNAPAQIQFALNEYLKWGGFPRVVLARHDEERTRVLTRYFDEILFKDIVSRHEIRNVMALRNIAVHMLTNTATLMTYKRMADVFQVSQELAQAYVGFLKDAFMVATLEFFSLKASERTRNPQKCHAIDLGLRAIASLSGSADQSKLLETIVHNHLVRTHREKLFYWKGEGEIDLLTHDGLNVSHLYQVAFAGLDQEKVAKREFASLERAQKSFPNAELTVVTWQMTELHDISQSLNAKVIPLWQFLLL